MRRLVASVRNASAGDLKMEWLKPFMHSRSLRAGSRLYSKGDAAREAFLLIEGRIQTLMGDRVAKTILRAHARAFL
jgi:CRP/FNR family transcriptional regulator, cyclic AMP receptor protein